MPAENYLLVGSDTREGADPDDPNAGAIGDADDAVGARSDTIMVLRRERNGGASLLSLPRDLWVDIAGTDRSAKINAAYNEGPRAARPDRDAVARHPDPPLRRGQLRRVHDDGRRDRRCRGVRHEHGPGHPLRPAAQPRLPGPRRLAGAGVRPLPPLRGVDRRRVGRGPAGRPRPHRAPATVHPHGGHGDAAEDRERPVLHRRPHRSGDVVGADRQPASTRSAPPMPFARPPSRACRPTPCRWRA